MATQENTTTQNAEIIESYRRTAEQYETDLARAYTMFTAVAKLADTAAPEAAELARLGADFLEAYRPETAA